MARVQYGRYETLGLIASGGMASVHLGRAVGPGGFERLVAIKVMHPHIADDPEFSHMFLDEARLAARIRHPNVVPTLDVSEDGRIIVMEYVEGASLNGVLRKLRLGGKDCLPLPITLRIILDVLDGLHAAHELHERDGTPLLLVHRDVSPHNMLVGVDGVSRITDFGIAYAEARLTSTQKGKLKGKMPYMAPEQLQGDDVDRRVDVYAAGCVLWEMLTGERLFTAANEAALACRVLAGAERSPRQIDERVPPPISAACMRALEERPQRYGSALEFCEALEDAAQRAEISVARPRNVSAFARKAMVSIGSIIASESGADSQSTGAPARANGAGAAESERTPATRRAAQTATGTKPAANGPDELPPAARPVTADSGEASVERTEDEMAEPSAGARATEHTGTDGSIVAPVSAVGRRSWAGWLLAVVGATVLTLGGGWLLLVATSGSESEPAMSTSASAPEHVAAGASAAAEPPSASATSSAASEPSASLAKPSARPPSSTAHRPARTGERPAPAARPTSTPTARPTATPTATSTEFHPPKL